MPQQHLLDCRGVDRHAGRGQVERGGAQILETRGGGADGDGLAGERVTGDITAQHPPGGDRAPRLRSGVVEPHASRFVGWNHQAAHRHCLDGRQSAVDPRFLDPDLIAARSEQDSEHLRGEARADVLTDAQHQRNAAKHSVDGREEVEAADSVRGRVDARQIGYRACEFGQHWNGAGPCDLDGIGTRGSHRVLVPGQGEAGDDRRTPYRIRQHRVVLGQVLDRVKNPSRLFRGGP